jgi:hypothetical protein
VTEDDLSPDDLDGARISVPEHVVHRAFDSETVLLNLETGAYHGLNPTAGQMLELLRDTGSASATAAAMAEKYGQPLDQVRRDVAELCRLLAARGLIELGAP